MKAPQITILADDLTGAADAAGFFGDLGLTTIVSLDSTSIYPADVVVINTHSRHLSLNEAVQQNAIAAQGILTFQATNSTGWIYKKIDSTLCGHPGAELNVLMNTLNTPYALIAPAFPEQGRTTVKGIQLVNGQPLEKTPFRDQVSTSSLRDLLTPHANNRQLQHIDLSIVRSGVAAVGALLQERSPALFIADAETNQDLRILARAAIAQNIRLSCGSAGLSRAFGQVLNLRSSAPPPRVPIRKSGPVLVIAGSQHPATRRQVERASVSGIVVISPTSLDIRAVQTAITHLSQGRDVILTTNQLGAPPGKEQETAQGLGWIARVIADRVHLGGLTLTGGDTAMAVLQSLGCRTLWLRGEIEPGIPIGQLLAGSQPGLAVVTKAGGFGSDGSLCSAIVHLKHRWIRRQNVST